MEPLAGRRRWIGKSSDEWGGVGARTAAVFAPSPRPIKPNSTDLDRASQFTPFRLEGLRRPHAPDCAEGGSAKRPSWSVRLRDEQERRRFRSTISRPDRGLYGCDPPKRFQGQYRDSLRRLHDGSGPRE